MRRRALTLAAILASVPSIGAQVPYRTLVGDGSGNFPGFGYSVAAVGDVDDDGVMDLAVGAPYEGENPNQGIVDGTAKLFSGDTGELLFPRFTDAVGSHYGWSLAGIGDVNSDGTPDLAIGSPSFNGVSQGPPGFAMVRSGFDGSELYERAGDGPGDEFGQSVAGAGDVDQDGVPDWAVGAMEDHELSGGPGYVRVFSGATGATIRTITTTGFNNRFGQSLVGAGDVNADGFPDLLVGISGRGRAQMRSGANGGSLWISSGGSTTQYGWDVALAGDVDSNGVQDLIVGAPYPSGGFARVVRSDTGATVLQVTGPSDSFFGGAVTGVGDVDFDGYDDIVVGAKWADGLVPGPGAAFVYSCGTGSFLRTIGGDVSGDAFGFDLAAIGDLNQDGRPDVAIGDTQDGPGEGIVELHSLAPRRMFMQRHAAVR